MVVFLRPTLLLASARPGSALAGGTGGGVGGARHGNQPAAKGLQMGHRRDVILLQVELSQPVRMQNVDCRRSKF